MRFVKFKFLSSLLGLLFGLYAVIVTSVITPEYFNDSKVIFEMAQAVWKFKKIYWFSLIVFGFFTWLFYPLKKNEPKKQVVL